MTADAVPADGPAGVSGPSDRVLDLFAVPGAVRPLAGRSVVAGDLVLSPGRDAAVAAWLNPTLARLAVRMDERPRRRRRDLRLAVPVPARDGSWVVDGWGATRYEPGTSPCADVDVLVATGRALHAEFAVAVPRRPDVLDARTDRWARAERLAFGAAEAWTGHLLLARAAARLAEVDLGPAQLVHADLAGNVLLDAAGAPVVIDVSPAWRPPRWAEAVCVVDAVARGQAPVALERFTDPAGRQALLRAVAFRLLSDPPDLVAAYAPVLDALGL